ncbi:hypothetical protein AMECASPLE_006162 [Ameca splendens]|uniref:Uncharacterized protein n=1 Tax=Ameca splendens TaxID=208324 RepID=A0ABV1A6G9_9TELE
MLLIIWRNSLAQHACLSSSVSVDCSLLPRTNILIYKVSWFRTNHDPKEVRHCKWSLTHPTAIILSPDSKEFLVLSGIKTLLGVIALPGTNNLFLSVADLSVLEDR